MSKTVTLATLISQARDRFEIDDGPVPDAMLTDWINGSYYALYNLIVDANPNWFLNESLLTITSGTLTVALPSDFWRAHRIDILNDNNQWVALRRMNISEEPAFTVSSVQDRGLTRYNIAGSNIRLTPTPTWTQASGLRLLYTPAPSTLASGGSPVSMDGVAGWEEWVILDVGIKFFVKNEWDPQAIMAQKHDIEKQIRDMASDCDVGNAGRVRDVYRERFINVYGKLYNP